MARLAHLPMMFYGLTGSMHFSVIRRMDCRSVGQSLSACGLYVAR